MPAGRPRIIKTPAEFEKRAGKYFAECEESGTPVTWTGLCLAVGLSSRESLAEYGRRDEFSDSVRWAKLRVEHAYELRLHGPSPGGATFALRNFGWKDRAPENTEDDEVRIVIQKCWDDEEEISYTVPRR